MSAKDGDFNLVDNFRLVDIEAAAAYLGGVSEWTVRGLIEDGELCPVRLPSVRRRGEASRRLLLDVRDLDLLIERSKTSNEPNAQLSAAAIKGWRQRCKKGVA